MTRHGALLLAALFVASAAQAHIASAAQAATPVRLLALSDAFDPALLDAFTHETGISVLVDGVPAPGDVEAALRQPGAPHDLLLLPSDGLGTRLRIDLLQPLPPGAVPEAAAVEPRLAATLPAAAAGRAVPYDWFPLGFVVNTARLKEAALPADPAAGWDLLGKPELLRQAEACGLGVPDRPQDLFALALGAGAPAARAAAAFERRRALAVLTQLRLQARRGNDAELADGLVQGAFCVALLPGPAAFLAIARGKDADDPVPLAFALPAGPGRLFVEALAIPAAATNRDGALRLMRFLLRPAVASANAAWGHVAPTVGSATAADAFTDPAALDRLSVAAPGDPALERLVETEWRRDAGR